jgi:hypothetical protein
MAIVQRWTGAEVSALRKAMRTSLEDFAAIVGITSRMVSKWEADHAVRLRQASQLALDGTLARCDPDTQARFAHLTTGSPDVVAEPSTNAQTHALSSAPADRIEHPHDGKIMVQVAGSKYLSGDANEPAWVGQFYMDVFPVTNEEYAAFVKSTGHRTPGHWPDQQPPRGLADHPVVFVTWEDATAYAEWAGKTLPTAHQWEKAARGTRGVRWPWGDAPTPAKCNVRGNGIGATTPVDRYKSGVSPYGVYDLCGNVWEWTSSATAAGRYQLRGGAWTSPFDRATPSAFNDAAATMYDDDTGFRCAATPF